MQKRDFRPFIYGGIASMVAELGTFPIDTTKTRLQIQGQKIHDNVQFRYKGMTDAFVQISRQEGYKSLYSGIWPAVLRQAVYGTIKFGTYYTLKDFIISHNFFESKDGEGETLWINIGCATIAGSVSSFIANPTDVLKVRMQIHGKGTNQKGLFKCFSEIYKYEGIKGLYRGSAQTAQRAAVIAAVELPVYDYCKHKLMDTLGNHVTNHIISSFIASLLASIASTPFDVIRTRLMNQRRLISSDGIQTMYYKNSMDCLVQSVRNEGLMSLYKGFIPTYLRMGPWNIIFFVIFEQLNTHL